MNLNGGTISGSTALSVESFTWTNGTLAGALTVNLLGESRFESGQKFTRGNATLNNEGTVNWTGFGDIGAVDQNLNVTFNNRAGALFDVQNDRSIYTNSSNSTITLNNAGTIRKSQSTGTSFWQVCLVDQGGTVDIQSGDISFAGVCR